ncbi:uncharacterized protein LOC131875945 [Cryptomeria japonica]|uniref:uncharacterized protein LOC131875945 n=1 Tax=Cryptomeria japonica TaxID=3369 RepID=UPI0027DAAC57|nr:uncharacterized protein LOC131875945 [Cryptomeria japonica]
MGNIHSLDLHDSDLVVAIEIVDTASRLYKFDRFEPSAGAVWADRVTFKKSIGFSPYELVYGKEVRLPLNNLLPVYKFVTEEVSEEVNFMEDRLMALAELDEFGREAQERNLQRQQMVKALHDRKACDMSFEEGEWVLKWNAKDQDKGKHGKFDALWLGPFIILEKSGENSYYLQDTDGQVQEFSVHTQYLKHFLY